MDTSIKTRKKDKVDSLEEFGDRWIHPNITVAEFIQSIKKEPDSTFLNLDVRYAIEVLRDRAQKGGLRQSQFARELLKRVGLRAYIPKSASAKEPGRNKAKYWTQRPYLLFDEILTIRRKIEAIHPKYNAEHCEAIVKQIVKQEYKITVTPEILFELTGDEKNKDITNLCVSIFCFQEDLNYHTLRNFVFGRRAAGERARYKERARTKRYGVDIKTLTTQKRDSFTLVDVYNDPEQGVNIYNEGYSRYRFALSFINLPFLCNDETRKRIFDDFSKT